MNKILCLFFIALILPGYMANAATAAETTKAEPKGPLLTRFEKTCLQNSTSEGRSQKELCGCLKANLGAKLDPAQLSLLVRFYEGDVAAKSTVQKTENSSLLDFDMETAEHCLQDPNWKATKGPVTKAETDAKAPEKGAPPEAAPAPLGDATGKPVKIETKKKPKSP